MTYAEINDVLRIYHFNWFDRTGLHTLVVLLPHMIDILAS